ncbi:hypothetical protein ISS04_01245 [Candidatus Woesearchaeota archaeon]|nr:hypothetical protein [Candidatus Woesearchaeota archaeon]
MGIFDFLKKFSKKEEEIIELELDEISGWINSQFEKNIEKIEIKLNNVREKIKVEKKKVKGNLEELKNAKLRNKNVPERIIQIINGNRDTYIQKVGLLMDEVRIPKEFKDIIKFCDGFEDVINNFSKSTLKAYQVLQEFFGDKSFGVAENIRDTDKFVKEAKSILKNAEIDELERLKQKVMGILEKINSKKDLEENISSTKKDLKEVNKKFVDKKEKLEQVKKSDEYGLFNDLVSKKESLENEKKELEMMLWHSFSVIEAGLKKYERVTLEKGVVKKYLANSLMALLKDTELKIVDVLNKMENSISNGDVELKDKKKEKILHELGKLNVDYFKEFLEKYNKIEWELDQLKVKFEESTIMVDIEKLKEEIDIIENKINSKKCEINEWSKELEELNVGVLKKKLEKEVKDKIGKTIVIS